MYHTSQLEIWSLVEKNLNDIHNVHNSGNELEQSCQKKMQFCSTFVLYKTLNSKLKV